MGDFLILEIFIHVLDHGEPPLFVIENLVDDMIKEVN
ncbi:MAG: hypothetical protein Ct9H300mP6_12820 [Gammaproteobacteria bacterium]|nr:MAG: hypothetical protein Ct9H300mP6_12820 [Gammaproteobacteria bacterium]